MTGGELYRHPNSCQHPLSKRCFSTEAKPVQTPTLYRALALQHSWSPAPCLIAGVAAACPAAPPRGIPGGRHISIGFPKEHWIWISRSSHSSVWQPWHWNCCASTAAPPTGAGASGKQGRRADSPTPPLKHRPMPARRGNRFCRQRYGNKFPFLISTYPCKGALAPARFGTYGCHRPSERRPTADLSPAAAPHRAGGPAPGPPRGPGSP